MSLTNPSSRGQVTSGVLPYGAEPESVTAFNIVSGDRPPRPKSPIANRWLPDPIWEAVQHCWAQLPYSRLSIDLLHQAFVKSEPEQEVNVPVTEDREGKHDVV